MNKEIRVNDLYATQRCLTALIDYVGDSLVKLIFQITLEKVTELITKMESGELQTKEVTNDRTTDREN